METNNDFSTNYYEKYFNDLGYNSIFLCAYSYLGNKAPSLYLITYFYIIRYCQCACVLPDEQLSIKMLKQCRSINKKKINISYKEVWDKSSFFDFIKEIIASVDLKANSIRNDNLKEIENVMLSYYRKTISDKTTTKKALFPLFDDVVGLEKAKQTIKERIIEPSLHRDIYEKYNVQVGGGILLYGLPGTGKTMFAQAVANEIDGHFISVKASDIKSKWYGDSEQKVKEIFDEARKYKISVIFFDEFEAIGVSRDKIGNEITSGSIVPELLNQLQGFFKNENILLVIAATNRPWDIDSALLRPGRLDTLVYVDLPNIDARKIMFKKYLNKIKVEDDIIDYLSGYTDGYNGSDIKEICDKLIRIVINKEISKIVGYEITFEDCVEVLKNKHTSVSPVDINKMNIFMTNNK